MNELYNESCEDTMKRMEENSIPFIICDPPYLLEFMGRPWDSQHKELEGDNDGQKMYKWHLQWVKETYRVLKPGGFLVAFGGTRTSHRLAQAMEDAGFEIRDTICWMYGSGFPKSYSISKGLDRKLGVEDKREFKSKNPTDRPYNYTKGETSTGWGSPIRPDKTNSYSEEAKKWEGWGTALKPAYEPILIGMKPMNGSFAENALNEGVAGINIDDSRIKRDSDDVPGWHKSGAKGSKGYQGTDTFAIHDMTPEEIQKRCGDKGRWPANVVLSHHPDCKMVGYKKIQGSYISEHHKVKTKSHFNPNIDGKTYESNSKTKGNETIENWECQPDCPVKMLDKQSGTLKSGELLPHHNRPGHTFHGTDTFKMRDRTGEVSPTYGDTGGASRFFYTAKASTNERNWKLDKLEEKEIVYSDYRENYDTTKSFVSKYPDGENRPMNKQRNNHPTVKPLDLCRYLVNMFSTPDGGLVYDPFAGSGTTLIACKILGRPYIGSEIDKEYYEIAVERLKYNWVKWWNDNKKEKIISPETKKTLNKFFNEE